MRMNRQPTPCSRCGGELFNVDEDVVGITFTCIVCGTCRYTDVMGAAVAVEQSADLSDYEPESDRSRRRIREVVCTVVRVFRRARDLDRRGLWVWDVSPSQGIHTVAVYHSRSPRNLTHPRRVLWAEVMPPLEEDLDEPSKSRFRRTVYEILEEAWGEGHVFNTHNAALELQPWGYSLRILGGDTEGRRWGPRATGTGWNARTTGTNL